MSTETLEVLPLTDVPAQLEFSAWVGTLVRDHRRALVRAAQSEGLEAEEALDAVQEAFATFIQKSDYQRLPRGTPDAPALLTVLVKNHARNMRRKRGRKDVSMDDLEGTSELDLATRRLDEVLVAAQDHIRLTGCLGTLKAVQRTIVTARFFEGMTGQEVARALGLTPGNVAVILHRARENLRLCLKNSRECLLPAQDEVES